MPKIKDDHFDDEEIQENTANQEAVDLEKPKETDKNFKTNKKGLSLLSKIKDLRNDPKYSRGQRIFLRYLYEKPDSESFKNIVKLTESNSFEKVFEPNSTLWNIRQHLSKDDLDDYRLYYEKVSQSVM